MEHTESRFNATNAISNQDTNIQTILKPILICMKIFGISPCSFSSGLTQSPRKWKRLSIPNLFVLFLGLIFCLDKTCKIYMAYNLQSPTSWMFISILMGTMSLAALTNLWILLLNQEDIFKIFQQLQDYVERNRSIINGQKIKFRIFKYLLCSFVTTVAMVICRIYIILTFPEKDFKRFIRIICYGSDQSTVLLFFLAIFDYTLFCFLEIISTALLKIFFLFHCMIFQECIAILQKHLNIEPNSLMLTIRKQKHLALLFRRFNRNFVKILLIWFSVDVFVLAFGIPATILVYQIRNKLQSDVFLTIAYHAYCFIFFVLTASDVQKQLDQLKEDILNRIEENTHFNKKVYMENVLLAEELNKLDFTITVSGYFTITKSLMLIVLVHIVTFSVIILQMSPPGIEQ